MAKDKPVCEQCGREVAEAYKCNTCGMIICPECLSKTRNRVPPCNCIWDDCNGWLEPFVQSEATLKT